MSEVNFIKRERNQLLDFLKGIGCIGVILTHVTFPGRLGAVLSKLSTFAVPVFFMISGYFAYDEHGYAQEKIRRRLSRIMKIFLFTLLLYVAYRAFRMSKLGNLGTWIKDTLNLKNLAGAVLYNDFDSIGAEHLWFLPALAYSYVFLVIVDKFKLYTYAYRLLPVLCMLNIMNAIGMLGMIRRTFLVSAVPFVVLGNYLAVNKKILKRFSNRDLCVAMLLSSLFICACFAIEWKINLSQLGVVISSSSLFMIAVKNPGKSLSRKLELPGEKYSLYVYVIHILLNSRLNVWLNR